MSEPVDDDDFEPLERLPLPVSIEAYDVEVVGPATIVRLFFTPRLGADPRPGNEFSEVVVLEQWDRVAIGLVRRIVAGDRPNNTIYGGEPLIGGAGQPRYRPTRAAGRTTAHRRFDRPAGAAYRENLIPPLAGRGAGNTSLGLDLAG